MTILAVTGLQRERRLLAGPGVEAVAGGGDQVRLAATLDRLAPGMDGIISIGIAGALAPGLRPGRLDRGNRRPRGQRGDADRPATGPIGSSLACLEPSAACCSAATHIAATAAHKADALSDDRRGGGRPGIAHRGPNRPAARPALRCSAGHFRCGAPNVAAGRSRRHATRWHDGPAGRAAIAACQIRGSLPALIRTGLEAERALSRLTPRPPHLGLDLAPALAGPNVGKLPPDMV